ncbi:hypothetical protein [Kordia jejudonensis]|uniref:hypothetical protein n=1 Tax=Kordia jejudonensis TaxID=1348245 RepID=UPI0006292561|nr:hypothetical protein [Kordia jejudonensis]
MKKIIGAVLCMCLLLISCASDDLTIEEMSLSKAEQDAIVKLVTTNLSITEKTQVTINEVKLVKINESYYLRSYHGDKITTTLLRVENRTTLKYAGISCTTTYCSTDTGCIPDKDGKKCTKCGAFSSDCTKTVTSDIVAD